MKTPLREQEPEVVKQARGARLFMILRAFFMMNCSKVSENNNESKQPLNPPWFTLEHNIAA